MPFRRLVWYILAALAIAAGLVYAFWPQPVAVDLAAVGRQDLVVTVDGEGQTRVREVYVISAPVSGRVLRIERHVGDDVTANETVLATLQPGDPTFLDARARAEAEAAVKAAEAALALALAERDRAEAELRFARSELSRARRLAATDNISERELDRAILEEQTREVALATAEASVTVRRFELENAKARLIQPSEADAREVSDCCVEVKSPVDGRILQLLHESEGVVQVGTPLLEVGDPRDLEVVVDLLSSDAVRIREGADAFIEGWGGDDMLAAIVRRIEPYGFTKVSALGIEEQRVNVIIDIAEPPERWTPLGHGYRVDARIVVWRGEGVLVIPLGALFRDGERWAAFVEEDGVARLRHLRIGHSNDRHAEILDGLSAGESVILHPGDRVQDGVRIVSR